MEIKRNEATLNRPEGDRVIDASFVFADIPEFVKQLKTEKSWEKNDRNGITVFKSSSLTIVITALQASAELAHNNVNAFMTVQLLDGDARVSTSEGDAELKENNLVAFHPGVPHTIHALTDIIILLSIYNKDNE